MAEVIPGGFYIKARKIKQSDIAHAAPCIREVWDWLISESNHRDNLSIGIRRGQCVRSIKDIQDGLSWYVGYRKMTYSKTQCEGALEYLRKKLMITTTKTTRGLIITVCNYDVYNNPENYEGNGEGNKKTTRRQQPCSTINKNDKNDNNEKNDKEEAAPPSPEQIQEFEKFEKWVAEKAASVSKMKEPFTIHQFFEIKEKFASAEISRVLQAMHNWVPLLKKNKSAYLTLLKWIKKDQNGTHKQPPPGNSRQQGVNQLVESLKHDLESSAGGGYNP
jgi:hypothetical protein